MSEEDLIKLGFTKCLGDNFYYYTLDIAQSLSFITAANDEINNDKWSVYIFQCDDICYTDVNELRDLINNLKKHKK